MLGQHRLGFSRPAVWRWIFEIVTLAVDSMIDACCIPASHFLRPLWETCETQMQTAAVIVFPTILPLPKKFWRFAVSREVQRLVLGVRDPSPTIFRGADRPLFPIIKQHPYRFLNVLKSTLLDGHDDHRCEGMGGGKPGRGVVDAAGVAGDDGVQWLNGRFGHLVVSLIYSHDHQSLQGPVLCHAHLCALSQHHLGGSIRIWVSWGPRQPNRLRAMHDRRPVPLLCDHQIQVSPMATPAVSRLQSILDPPRRHCFESVVHLAFAAVLVPYIGQRVVFYSAWALQVVLSSGSIGQLMSRGHSKGRSWSIW